VPGDGDGDVALTVCGQSETRESPLSRIFGGKQRSTLRVPGQKDSATVEPFLTLQLDIQVSVHKHLASV
jgi:hypothetical protein